VGIWAVDKGDSSGLIYLNVKNLCARIEGDGGWREAYLQLLCKQKS